MKQWNVIIITIQVSQQFLVLNIGEIKAAGSERYILVCMLSYR